MQEFKVLIKEKIDNQYHDELFKMIDQYKIYNLIKRLDEINDGEQDFKLLSVSGGGLLVAGSIYVLKRTEELFKIDFNDYDLIAGASAGSLVAGMFRMGFSAAQIMERFIKTGEVIFSKKKFTIPLIGGPSIYSKEPLKSVLNGTLKNMTFRDLKPNKDLFIFALNLSHENENFLAAELSPDLEIEKALSASCSVPGYFDYEIINDNRYMDGAMVANQPILQAILYSLITKNIQLKNISIFVINCIEIEEKQFIKKSRRLHLLDAQKLFMRTFYQQTLLSSEAIKFLPLKKIIVINQDVPIGGSFLKIEPDKISNAESIVAENFEELKLFFDQPNTIYQSKEK